MADPYAEHERDEARLRAALWAATGAALFLALRKIPARIGGHYSASAIRRRDLEFFLRSEWWRRPWLRFEEVVATVIVRISRRASRHLIRQLSADLGAQISARVADRIAQEYAARIVAEMRASTVGGLSSAMLDVSRDLAPAALRRALGDRLGPTARQLRRIRRWELGEIAAGNLTPQEILSGVRRRAENAAALRARVFASDSMVRQVSDSRIEVLKAAGLLVSSGNPLDDRTRPAHRLQTRITRATPTPAGSPWAPGAPFPGLPPYQHLCRCWVESRAG